MRDRSELDLEDILKRLPFYRDRLLEDTLPFWLRFGIDRDHGGILTCLNRDGSLLDSDKGVWQQGRFAWLMGKLYNCFEPNPQWLQEASHTVAFLERFCFDPADGRMWFHVSRQGDPIRKRRYSFSESFAAISLGQYAKATGDQRYADLATQVFYRFVQFETAGKAEPKFTDYRPSRGIGKPMITINTAQELRESIQLPEADQWIDRSIQEIRDFHWNEEFQCVLETVGPEGQFLDHFDGRTLNPGHAIEGAWFILEEGRQRGDETLVKLGCQMLDAMWERGWDQQYGGILYFVDCKGLPVQEYWHDMKFWWPQNETMIATLLAYELTGNRKYKEWFCRIHDWAFDHFPDQEYGEWYGYLHRDGSVSSQAKGNLWKGPFHLPRMQWMVWQIMDRLADSLGGQQGGGDG